MPAWIMCTYSPEFALKPMSEVGCLSSSPTMTDPSKPALLAIALRGALQARSMISTPIFWSMFSHFAFTCKGGGGCCGGSYDGEYDESMRRYNQQEKERGEKVNQVTLNVWSSA